MDCQTCNELLLDLAYGELDEVRAAAVRKHTDSCGECQQALGRISQGRTLARQLPIEEPPPISESLRHAIDAAAQAYAEAQSKPAGGHAEVIPIARPPRGLPRWLDRLGEIAMRRQIAMAAVFLVAIGVGLVFYQTHPRPSETQDDRVPDVVPAVEVTGSPAVRPGTAPQTVSRRPPVGLATGRSSSVEREDRSRVSPPSSVPATPTTSAATRSVTTTTSSSSTHSDSTDMPQAPAITASAPQTLEGHPHSAGTAFDENPSPSPLPNAPAPEPIGEGPLEARTAAIAPSPPASAAESHNVLSVPTMAASSRAVRAAPRRSYRGATSTLSRGNATEADLFDLGGETAHVQQVDRDANSDNDITGTIARLQQALSRTADAATRARISFQIAELYRRAGRPQEASVWMARAQLEQQQSASATYVAGRSQQPARVGTSNQVRSPSNGIDRQAPERSRPSAAPPASPNGLSNLGQ